MVPLGRAQDSRPVAAAQEAPRLAPALDTSALSLREIGPASMGGRVVDLAVDERNPSKFYVATAAGGLWKTVNNGTTFTPQFQNEVVMSIGDIAIDPMNSDHIWIGTGEANNRNSTSWGNGVYYSADGGKTWKHKGLDKTRHIGRIV
ncbi:MAG TPA: glycosyl hydrolase, partial [Planctomycetota bacterium]|nr:glycosyl hydrolase [Planctomycetota bacterium]